MMKVLEINMEDDDISGKDEFMHKENTGVVSMSRETGECLVDMDNGNERFKLVIIFLMKIQRNLIIWYVL